MVTAILAIILINTWISYIPYLTFEADINSIGFACSHLYFTYVKCNLFPKPFFHDELGTYVSPGRGIFFISLVSTLLVEFLYIIIRTATRLERPHGETIDNKVVFRRYVKHLSAVYAWSLWIIARPCAD